MNKFFERFKDPEYWIKMRERFTWHSRKAMCAEYRTPEYRHHSRCMCMIGAWLQQDVSNFREMDKVFHVR